VYFLAGDLHSAHAISLKLRSGALLRQSGIAPSPFEQSPFTLATLLDHPARTGASQTKAAFRHRRDQLWRSK
jgi:hypothetical protein